MFTTGSESKNIDESYLVKEYKDYNIHNFNGTAFIGKVSRNDSNIINKNVPNQTKNEKSYKSLRIAQKEIDDKYQQARGLVNGTKNSNIIQNTFEGLSMVRHRVAVMEEKNKPFATVTSSLRPRMNNCTKRQNRTFIAQEKYEDMKNAHSFV